MTAITLEDMTSGQRRAAIFSVPCPRCRAAAGQPCRSPNGWAARHQVRERLARGETVIPPKLGRLTDAQAQRIEWAAEAGQVYASHHATEYGDRAQITCVEKLAEKGLLVLVGDDGTERTFALTVAGWKVYREHRLVIRRLSDAEIDAGEAAAIARELKERTR